MTDIDLDELIAEARSLSTYEGSTLERAADALERLRAERDEAMAVIEKALREVSPPFEQRSSLHLAIARDILSAAHADALREHDATMIESLAGMIRHEQHAESIRQMLIDEARERREGVS